MLSNLKRTFGSMAAISLTAAALMLAPCGVVFAGTVPSAAANGDTSATLADLAASEQSGSKPDALLSELLDSATITAADSAVTAPGVIAMAETTAFNADNQQCDLHARSMSCN